MVLRRPYQFYCYSEDTASTYVVNRRKSAAISGHSIVGHLDVIL